MTWSRQEELSLQKEIASLDEEARCSKVLWHAKLLSCHDRTGDCQRLLERLLVAREFGTPSSCDKVGGFLTLSNQLKASGRSSSVEKLLVDALQGGLCPPHPQIIVEYAWHAALRCIIAGSRFLLPNEHLLAISAAIPTVPTKHLSLRMRIICFLAAANGLDGVGIDTSLAARLSNECSDILTDPRVVFGMDDPIPEFVVRAIERQAGT